MPSRDPGAGASPTVIITILMIFGLIAIIFLAALVGKVPSLLQARAEDLERIAHNEPKILPSQILDSIPVVAYRASATRQITAEGAGETPKPETGSKRGSVYRLSRLHTRARAGPADSPQSSAAKDPATGPTTSSTEELPGCSICTDRFEDGQGMRVLPCRHMFHVMCIDDWILKFSETCPLWRVRGRRTRRRLS
jgi:hypothetical protein